MTAVRESPGSTRRRQLELLGQLQSLSPAPFLMGGFAEDALLHGGFSREHGDVDLMVERSDLEALLGGLRALGFDGWESWGDNTAGDPFYLSDVAGGVMLELGVTDRDESGQVYIELGSVRFELDPGAEVGYRVYLPEDTYRWPATSFEGMPVRTISPLAAFQMRMGIASRGTFGEARPHERGVMEELRATFFPDAPAEDLAPLVRRSAA